MDDDFIRFLKDHKRSLTFSTDGVNQVSFSGFKQTYSVRNFANQIGERGGCMFLSGYELDTVIWVSNFITTQPVRANMDVISFDFGGCSMAMYFDGSQWTAAHIHSGPVFNYDCRRKWIEYMIAHPEITQLRMFKPDYSFCTGANLYKWGVITKEGHCYTVFVKSADGMTFRLHQIREHTAGSLVGDYAAILDPGLVAGFDDQTHLDHLKQVWENFWIEQDESYVGCCGCCGW